MRLLICSDFQLGSGAAYGTAARPRLRDQEETLEHLQTVAADRGCSVALFLGDAFEHRRPGIDELIAFGRWHAEMPCETLMLAGNHDVRGPGLRTTLDLFGETDEAERDVFTWPGVTTRSLPGERPVAFAFLPWAHPGSLRAARGPLAPQEHASALLEVAAGLRAQVEEQAPGAYPILCTHFALEAMGIPSGLATTELVGEPVLDTHALLAQGWAYIFAGHIHKPDVVGTVNGDLDPGVAVSVGAPWVQDFGEEHVLHGAWILDTETDELLYELLPGRPFVTVDLEGDDTAGDVYRFGVEVEGAVVRVRIRATQEQAEFTDVAALRADIMEAGAHKVYSVSLDVQRSVRARAEGLAEDTEPLEALDAWAAAAQLAPKDAERLRALTRDYIEGMA